jgi:hypothetical protein
MRGRKRKKGWGGGGEERNGKRFLTSIVYTHTEVWAYKRFCLVL